MESRNWPRHKLKNKVDPMLLDQKMASCSEEKKKRLETHLTVTRTVHAQRCKCWNSKTNTEQSTNQSWHRNSMRREQHRKANSTLQKTNSARTTSYPSNPIAKRAMLSHAADTLCSPANYLRDCSDVNLLCFCFNNKKEGYNIIRYLKQQTFSLTMAAWQPMRNWG